MIRSPSTSSFISARPQSHAGGLCQCHMGLWLEAASQPGPPPGLMEEIPCVREACVRVPAPLMAQAPLGVGARGQGQPSSGQGAVRSGQAEGSVASKHPPTPTSAQVAHGPC